jgi:hypothetical protein
MSGALLGLNARLYSATTRATWGALGTDGYTHEGAAPAGLAAINNVKDLTLPIETGEADVSTRGNNGWEASLATLKKGELTFNMVYDTGDAGMLLIQKSYFLNANLPLAVLDGDKATSGTRGIWADWMVTKFEKTENLADAQMVSVSLKPAYSAVGPEPVKVTP